jgi:pimeloyl-ACP methyl ester carboxylesterase
MDLRVERDGVGLYARLQGEGPTVLLHTGGLGDGGMWREYLPLLSGFRLVAMDHRGRGRSDRVVDVEGHRMPEYVADAAAVIEAAQGSSGLPVGFVGYSMGAQIGYALAGARPDLVAALVGLGGSWESGQEDGTDELVALLDDGGVAGFIDQVENDELMPVPDWLRRQFLATDASQFRNSLLALRGWDPWSVAGQITCPTCLVCGEREDPDATIGVAADRLLDASAAWLPGLGHVGAFLAASEVTAVIAPFLRAHLPH